jgi:hypothetical protein
LSRRPGTWALLPGNCPAGFERPLCQWFGSKGLRALRRPPPREAEDLSGPARTAARAGGPNRRTCDSRPFGGFHSLCGGPFLFMEACGRAAGAAGDRGRRLFCGGGDKDALNVLRDSPKKTRGEASMALKGASERFARRLPGTERRCVFDC